MNKQWKSVFILIINLINVNFNTYQYIIQIKFVSIKIIGNTLQNIC